VCHASDELHAVARGFTKCESGCHKRCQAEHRERDAVYSTERFINQTGEQRMAVDQLSTTFAALADPTRRAILDRLAHGEATVSQLAEPFPITLQAVSKHLKVLERAGLIARGRSAQLRPSRLQGEALRDAADWLAGYRGFWEGRFDRLDAHLARSRRD
jgi:DNA-binding transcriptional ArsR family regulator